MAVAPSPREEAIHEAESGPGGAEEHDEQNRQRRSLRSATSTATTTIAAMTSHADFGGLGPVVGLGLVVHLRAPQ